MVGSPESRRPRPATALDYPADRRPDAVEEGVLRRMMRRGVVLTRVFAWGVFLPLSAMLLVMAWQVLSDGWPSGDLWVILLNVVAQPPIWWFAFWVAPRAHRGGPDYGAPLRRVDGILAAHVTGTGSGAMTLRLGGLKVYVPRHWPEVYGRVRALAFAPHPRGRGLSFVIEMELLDEALVRGSPPVLSVADDIQTGRIAADAVRFADRSTGPMMAQTHRGG